MNLDSKSPRKELRRSFAGFQQKSFPLGDSTGLNLQNKLRAVAAVSLRSHFFRFAFATGFPDFTAGLCAAAAGLGLPFGFPCIFISASCAFSELFPAFLSLPLGSFCFGGSLIPESFRRVFSRSSGVLPRPFNCSANICSTAASNFGPSGIPMRVNSSRTVPIPARSGRNLFKYAFIFEQEAATASRNWDSARRIDTHWNAGRTEVRCGGRTDVRAAIERTRQDSRGTGKD